MNVFLTENPTVRIFISPNGRIIAKSNIAKHVEIDISPIYFKTDEEILNAIDKQVNCRSRIKYTASSHT